MFLTPKFTKMKYVKSGYYTFINKAGNSGYYQTGHKSEGSLINGAGIR